MDGQIRLRHETTGQECTFEDQAAAKNFARNVPDVKAWRAVDTAGASEPAAEAAPDVEPDAA